MQNLSYTLEILVNNKPVSEFKDKDNNCFIEGRKGSEYTLRIRNNTNKRILAVPSVDGLSVMDGKPASEKSNGYVLNAYQTLDIPGWRLDSSDVAKFVFEDLKGSYSEQMRFGTSNVGVIGVMFFKEQEIHKEVYTFINTSTYFPFRSYNYNDIGYNSRGMSAGPIVSSGVISNAGNISSGIYQCYNTTASTSSDYQETSVGTVFGDKKTFNTVDVDFTRNSEFPDSTFIIYYDSRSNLYKKYGIKVEEEKKTTMPKAFPKACHSVGCEPPKNWRK